jgi:hypothetical protein
MNQTSKKKTKTQKLFIKTNQNLEKDEEHQCTFKLNPTTHISIQTSFQVIKGRNLFAINHGGFWFLLVLL